MENLMFRANSCMLEIRIMNFENSFVLVNYFWFCGLLKFTVLPLKLWDVRKCGGDVRILLTCFVYTGETMRPE